MKQAHFNRVRSGDWDQLEKALKLYEKRGNRPKSIKPSEMVKLYRRTARDLYVAQSRSYSTDLVDRLNALCIRGHNVVYTYRSGWLAKLLEFLTAGFPRQVRKQWPLVLASAGLFLIPALVTSLLIIQDPQRIYSIMTDTQISSYESMYDPNNPRPRRQADSSLAAFGYYVANNAAIGLRTAASGVLLGIGTAIILIFNGTVLSAVTTHLWLIGSGPELQKFVAGHSSTELVAIVLSGAAGLRFAQALIAPGRTSRVSALRDAAKDAMVLAYGAFLMFLLAAFIEAFWSPWRFSGVLKYNVGIALWVIVISYFLFAGRSAVRSNAD